MNIETNNSIQASTYTIDPAVTEDNMKRLGESRTEENSSNRSDSDSIRISDDARAERDKKIIEELEKIDRQVQQHEAAHQAAAGEFFRGKSFTYKVGPDGKRYAVAGEVHIDTSAISQNPKATVAKMERIRRAAMAPSDPSPQDLSVASEAAKIEADAAAQEQAESMPTQEATQLAPGIIPQETKGSESSKKQELSVTNSSAKKKVVPSPNLPVSILYNSGASLLSPQRYKVDLSV